MLYEVITLINNTNAMDIIFCRNVMIYFSQDVIKEVINKLYKSLVPGGILIVRITSYNVCYTKLLRLRYQNL